MDAAYSSELLVNTYKTLRCHNLDHHPDILRLRNNGDDDDSNSKAAVTATLCSSFSSSSPCICSLNQKEKEISLNHTECQNTLRSFL
jgi:hypothetical protein